MSSTPQQSPAPGANREAPIPELVDELGPLKERIAAGREAEKLAKPIQAQLVERLGLKPEEQRVVDGKKYTCVIEAQQNEREITDMGRLFDTLGRDSFLEYCSFSPANVYELLGDGAAVYIKTERTGARKFKLIRMFVAVKKALKKAA